MKPQRIVQSLTALLLFSMAAVSTAESWPTKPVRIVFPYAVGGSGDAVARNLAMRIEAATKQNVVVENITGAATISAAQSVINAEPDGSRLFFTGSSTMTVVKHTNSKLSIDPEKELTPITFVNTLPHWLIIRSDRKEKSFEEFVDFIRQNPGKVSISVNAVGASAHLSLADWAIRNKLDIVIVPYRGSPPAMNDLFGGMTTAHIDVVGSSLQHVRDGRVRALALLQKDPIADIPEVPVAPDEKEGGLLIYGQHLLAVKAGTPDAVVNDIYRIVSDVTAEPGFVELLKNFGYERAVPTPSETQAILKRESKGYADKVRTTNIRLN